MAEKFDLAAVLGRAEVFNSDTGSVSVELIDIDLIDEDPKNFYNTDNVDNLAESIALAGLLDPINVRPHPEAEGRYMVISGHRRRKALRKLIDDDGRDDLRQVPCIVKRSAGSEAWNELLLIYGNSATRDPSAYELSEQARRVEELFYILKDEGIEFPGRMRDHVAQACNTTAAKLGRLKAIDRSLKSHFYEKFKDGTIAESVAYELSKLDGCMQDIFWRAWGESGKDLRYLYANNVARSAKIIGEVTAMTNSLSCSAGRCDHGNKLRLKAATLESWSSLFCRGCCLKCSQLSSCSYCCEHSKHKKKQLRAENKAADQEAAARQEAADKPHIDRLSQTWKRVADQIQAANISDAAFCNAAQGWTSSVDLTDMANIRAGKKQWTRQSDYPGNLSQTTAERLAAAADLLGCSIDFLLGHDTQPTPAVAFGWQTGEPAEPGEYPVLASWFDKPMLDLYFWTGEMWKMSKEDLTGLPPASRVLQWCPRPEGL